MRVGYVRYDSYVDIFVTDGTDCDYGDSFSGNKYDTSQHYEEHFQDDKVTHSAYNKRVSGPKGWPNNSGPGTPKGNLCVLLQCTNFYGACGEIDFKVKMSCADSPSTNGSSSGTKSVVKYSPEAPSDDTSNSYSYDDIITASPSYSAVTESDRSDNCPREWADRAFVSDCGFLMVKSDEWCEGVCYTWSESLCCDTDVGALAGLIIGVVVAIVMLSILCCFCGKCCCFKPKNEGLAAVVMSAPAVVVSAPASVHVQSVYTQ